MFGYTGRLWDADTGLQNNLHRWYDPAVGRWASEDPIGFAGDPGNVYRYCYNSPGNWIDPSGLETMSPLQTSITWSVSDYCVVTETPVGDGNVPNNPGGENDWPHWVVKPNPHAVVPPAMKLGPGPALVGITEIERIWRRQRDRLPVPMGFGPGDNIIPPLRRFIRIGDNAAGAGYGLPGQVIIATGVTAGDITGVTGVSYAMDDIDPETAESKTPAERTKEVIFGSLRLITIAVIGAKLIVPSAPAAPVRVPPETVPSEPTHQPPSLADYYRGQEAQAQPGYHDISPGHIFYGERGMPGSSNTLVPGGASSSGSTSPPSSTGSYRPPSSTGPYHPGG